MNDTKATKIKRLTIRKPSDFHVHLRQSEVLEAYTLRTAMHFENILVMPNIIPPITTAERLINYKQAIDGILTSHNLQCNTLMTFKLVPGMGKKTVCECLEQGAVAGKYYPAGSTTNAEDGPSHPADIKDELSALEQAGGFLSIHAEAPTSPDFLKEHDFFNVIDYILSHYSKLRIVIEHLSTAEAVSAVLQWPSRTAGTITAHHLSFTIDDLLDQGIDSSLYCKPVLKTHQDREALIKAATSGNPKFFFGSDSAPHPISKKSSFPVSAGTYTAPVRLSLLAEVFEAYGTPETLQYFTSTAGTKWYGLPASSSTITLIKKPWTVPDSLEGTIPAAHGKTLNWQVEQ